MGIRLLPLFFAVGDATTGQSRVWDREIIFLISWSSVVYRSKGTMFGTGRGESSRNGHRSHPVKTGSSLIILVINSNPVNKLHKVVGVS
jgi:hypothetical protein